MLKHAIKNTLMELSLPVTRNMRYDLLTRRVLQRVLVPTSNCIDVGALDGDFTALYRRFAPQGRHWAFEPIPAQYEKVAARFSEDAGVTVVNAAVADFAGDSTFNHVVSNPSYSGLQKRRYDRKEEEDTNITVEVTTLDAAVPTDVKVDFIKIDVEGAELGVLQGAQRLIAASQPVVVFEFGKGASDVYGTGPSHIWDYFEAVGMQLYLPDTWLKGRPAMTKATLAQHYNSNDEYYFLAHA